MRRVLPAMLGALAALTLLLTAAAEEGDSVSLGQATARIGDQVTVTLTVVTDPGATVEVDPGGEGWAGFEVLRITSQSEAPQGTMAFHTIVIVVAGFALGDQTVAPAVNIIHNGELQQRTLPGAPVRVEPTLGANDPLELTPLPPPAAIGGAESPFLRPAIAAGVVAGLLVVAALLRWLVRRWAARRRLRPAPEEPVPLFPDLSQAAALIDTDPVRAYRLLSATVRAVLGDRYGFPAPALTTREMRVRMERVGVDRWEARLVGGLLSECDAVVYAGYRPAHERRQADLTMAREIVEAGEFDEQGAVA